MAGGFYGFSRIIRAMHGDAIVSIGTVVGSLGKFLVAAGVRGIWASVACFIICAGVVAVYAYSANDFARETTYQYLVGFAAVIGTAGGVFHGMEEFVKSAQTPGGIIRKMTGNGDN